MQKPVLGLFNNEGELRDSLANNLGVIESGLQLVSKNYPVRNYQGASGSFDILAKDKYGGFVIIEVKRSNSAARQALHELSKYIVLFMEDQKVDSQRIRCFVISTHWHELDVPLAYFKDTIPVDVKGFTVDAPKRILRVTERALPPIDVLPKLCPDARFLFFENEREFVASQKNLIELTSRYPQIQAALLLLSGGESEGNNYPRAVLCVWRLKDSDLDVLKEIFDEDDPTVTRSYYEGWSAESCVLNWLVEQSGHQAPPFNEQTLATPEKINSVSELRPFTDLIRLGGWSPHDLINDVKEVSRCLVAHDVSPVARRANRHFFEATSSPKTGKSWVYTSEAFKSFIGFVEFWQVEVERYLDELQGHCDVDFFAQDCKHLHYRIYQNMHDDRADLSQFKLTVKSEAGDTLGMLIGGWAWDGNTYPLSAVDELQDVYGSLDWARIALFSGADTQRYEAAYVSHGFLPYVVKLNVSDDGTTGQIILTESHPRGFDVQSDLSCFVRENPDYCEQIANIMSGIPADPRGRNGVVLIQAGN